MSAPITAAILYDLVNCPHRVTMDAFGNAADRDPVNAFVELLWKRGTAFEYEVIADLSEKISFVNLRPFAGAEKEQKTLEAMRPPTTSGFTRLDSADALRQAVTVRTLCGSGSNRYTSVAELRRFPKIKIGGSLRMSLLFWVLP
jgi:hypothetical protein